MNCGILFHTGSPEQVYDVVADFLILLDLYIKERGLVWGEDVLFGELGVGQKGVEEETLDGDDGMGGVRLVG